MDCLGDFVNVAGRGDAGPDVQELLDALVGQKRDGATQKAAVDLQDERQFWVDRRRRLGCLAVNREIVRAAQEVVIHPRDVRPVPLELFAGPRRSLH